MKVPLGYGNCHILFDTGGQPSETQRDLYFKIDQSSFYEVDEWSEKHITLARSKEKDIYGYHFNFDLRLYDEDLGSGTQENLINFLYYYNLNTYKDKRFWLFPYRGGGNYATWGTVEKLRGMFEVISIGYPTLSNIADKTRAKGQYLTLKCETKFILDKDNYNYITYRDTSDGNWASLPTTSNVGQGETPTGSIS